jgi:regulatory protein
VGGGAAYGGAVGGGAAGDGTADDALDDRGRDPRGRAGRGRGQRGNGRGWGGGRAEEGAGERGPEPARDPAQVARDICLQQLAVRPRTRAELAAVLRKRGIDDQVATEVLDRYDEVGLIDDAAFATAWVTSRHHGKGLARRALAGELRRRGIDGELAGAALEEVDPETEAATARALVDRKLRTMPAGRPDAVFRRLVGLLARKGYAAGLAVTTVKEALAAREDDMGAFADVVDPDDLPDLVGDPEDPIR